MNDAFPGSFLSLSCSLPRERIFLLKERKSARAPGVWPWPVPGIDAWFPASERRVPE